LPGLLIAKPAAICATITLVVAAILSWRRVWTMDLNCTEPPIVVSRPPPRMRREPRFAYGGDGARVLNAHRETDSWTVC
jgi:hypothetical protein